jgi:hypothetical protein
MADYDEVVRRPYIAKYVEHSGVTCDYRQHNPCHRRERPRYVPEEDTEQFKRYEDTSEEEEVTPVSQEPEKPRRCPKRHVPDSLPIKAPKIVPHNKVVRERGIYPIDEQPRLRNKHKKKFVFTFGTKNGHVWQQLIKSNAAIYVNGKCGPVLRLYKGYSYFFSVDQDKNEHGKYSHKIVLTEHPMGGIHKKPIQPVPSSFAPMATGTFCFEVTERTPKYFYYQCTEHTHEGGLIVVHDSQR